MTDEKDNQQIDEQVKKVVIANLQNLSPDLRMHIGSMGEFSREQLIEIVEKETEVGAKIVEIQLNFLRKLKEGIFYGQNLVDNET
ncbi:MAG: hypothetical protein Q8O66_01260 [bacterium]|nr:hypothetical protein [bacterium]